MSALDLSWYATGKVDAVQRALRTYALPGSLYVKCRCSANLTTLALWGAANSDAATCWVDDEGSVSEISGAQATELVVAVAAFDQLCWLTLGRVLADIKAGAMTSTAAVDTALELLK